MSSDNDNMIPPEPLVIKTLKGVVSHTKSSPPLFVGDNDHGDMPVPQYALERELKDARREIKDLRTRLHEIKKGYEGCCHACEPVGAENCRLRELLNHTPEDILMRNQQLAIEIERLRKERDEALTEICNLKKKIDDASIIMCDWDGNFDSNMQNGNIVELAKLIEESYRILNGKSWNKEDSK